MKISASKKQLAKIISENGGWRDGCFAVQNGDHGRISFSVNKPVRHDRTSWMVKGEFNSKIEVCKPLPNWHQTILSRDEYFHLYPAQDADGWIEWRGGECPLAEGTPIYVRHRDGVEIATLALGDWNVRWTHDDGVGDIIAYRLRKTEVEAEVPKPTPTIEQLAAEYRNRKDYAERKQQEADAAKAEAEAKLAELAAAGKAVGLVVGVSAPEPELVVTDWRDLQVGDVVAITSVFGRDNSGYEHLIDREAVVVAVGNTEFQELVVDRHGIEVHVDGFRFIRRPAKEADNA